MRALRFIGYSLLVIFGLLAAGLAALWVFNPFAPPIIMTDPGPTGRRVTDNGLLANYYPPPDEGRHPGILLIGGSEGGLGSGATRIAKALQATPCCTPLISVHPASAGSSIAFRLSCSIAHSSG